MSLPIAVRTLPRALAAPSHSSSAIIVRNVTRSFSSFPQLQAATKNQDKKKIEREKLKKKRKRHPGFKQHDLAELERFTLCDAMRYIKAFEVGRTPTEPKYDVAIKVKTNRDGPVIRNQMRLPHAVKTDIRVAVICPPTSPAAKAAKAAGAVIVGEENIFELVKTGQIDFDRCIAHPDSLPKIAKEGLPRILGPRGLMPSVKLGTVAANVGPLVQNMLGGSMYRERQGVVRMAIGQLGFTPEQLRDNVKAFVTQVKQEAARLSEQSPKEVYEVVLSSTHSPGFSLNGEFKSQHSPPAPVLAAT